MKDVVAYVVSSHGYSERRACQVTRQHRSTQRKPSTRDPRTEVRQRMHEIVATRIRYGYRRVHVMLKREGWGVGRNVVYRLYREEGLVLRTKQPRRRKMGDCQIFCARGRLSSSDDEPFAEDHGELGLCLRPLARRPFPFLGRLVEHEV
jgi:hypothetical protein